MDVEGEVKKVDQKIKSCSQQDVEISVEKVWYLAVINFFHILYK